jgi:glyoxylase-like metal-dependent hydrolase (beta-lactamase superfamily II)
MAVTETWKTIEVAPSIWRIESILGPRPFSQYLLRGERTLLVDSGIVSTPADVLLPALASLGVDRVDFVLNTHADVDHFGGNHALVEAFPGVLVCAHAADAGWIADRERILRERYGWYAGHGIPYDPDTAAWLRDALGPDVPVALRLAGGEVFRLGPALDAHVLHLPGHSNGHVGIWEPASRTAIVQDAVMAKGLLDTEGAVIHPSPYFDAAQYVGSVELLESLQPARLLTAHYAVIEGDDVRRFLDDTRWFVARARAVVAEELAAAGEVTLAALLERADAKLGPFTSMPNELAGPLRTHLRELVAAGRAEQSPDGLRWRHIP